MSTFLKAEPVSLKSWRREPTPEGMLLNNVFTRVSIRGATCPRLSRAEQRTPQLMS